MIPVVVRYTAKPGAEESLSRLVAEHWPVLHEEGLTSDRPAVVIQVERHSGVFIEYYEWASEEAVQHAHERPAVRAIWDAMEHICKVEPWDGSYLVPPSHA